MADSNDGDRSDTLSDSESDRPGFEPPEPDHTPPRSPTKAPASRRRALWGAAAVVVVAGAATTGVMIGKDKAPHHRPPPTHSPPAPTTPPSLPISAVHDAHGLIITLPNIRQALRPEPTPGVPLAENRLTTQSNNGITVAKEENRAIIESPSRFRILDITLTKWPSPKSFGRNWGREGPAPSHKDAHNWIDKATHVTGIKGTAIIYQRSQGPYEASTTPKNTEYDRVGAVLQARYRNVMIEIDFSSADFNIFGPGPIEVTYTPYSDIRFELTKIAQDIIDHL